MKQFFLQNISLKHMVTEMSSQGNVQLGKCLVGEVSVGEVSGRGIVRLGTCPSGKCPSGKCHSGISPWESVSWGNVHILIFCFHPKLERHKRINFFSICDSFLTLVPTYEEDPDIFFTVYASKMTFLSF